MSEVVEKIDTEAPVVKPAAPVDISPAYAGSRSVGQYRTITPCPTSGRINFQQIGNLREYRNRPISMDDNSLLVCRRPEPTTEDGRLVYRHLPPTYDPSDFYGAMWGSEGNVARGKYLPMNPINTWNENFPGTYPTESPEENYSFQYRSCVPAGNGFTLTAKSLTYRQFVGFDSNGYGVYETRYIPMTVNAVAYVGRFDPGTVLSMAFETTNYRTNGEATWKMQLGFWNVRGWSQGFFNGSVVDYASGSIPRNQTATQTATIQIDDLHRDLWIAFQQDGSDSSENEQWHTLHNFQIWRA